MKMSDIFEGRVVLDSSCGKVGGGCLEIGDDLGWIAHFGIHNERDINESNEAAIHAIYAINNHDRMVEEIAELKEAFKELKSIAIQEREWRLEDLEIGHCEAQESMDTLSYKIDNLLAKLNQEGKE